MESAVLRTGDLITIVTYLVGMVVLGFFCARRVRTTEGYFVGGRAMPGWAVGLSMLATAISSITFLAYPGSAYAGNWSLLVPGLMLPIAAFFGIKIFVPFYRKAMLVSAYQYLERRFGTLGRVYACLVFSTLSIWRMAIVLFLLALPIKTLTGWESDTTILVCGVVVTTYTVMGGIQAVVWIDVVQGILLMLGGLVTIATVFVTVPGGPLEIFREGWAARKFNLGVSFEWDFCKMTLWVLVLNGLIGNLQEFSSDQTKVQRYCAAKTTQAAQRAAWVCGLGCIPVWVMFMFVGTCLFVYYQNFPDRLASGLRADEIFPHFILTQMPSGLGGLVVAAVMAAAMAIDSSMNATASVLTKDIYENLYFPGKTDKHYLIVGIVISAILGLCMVLGALLLTTIQRSTILEIAFIIGAICTGGLGGFVFLGFFSTRANGRGAAVGVIYALILIVYLTLSELGALPENLKAPLHPFLIGVVGNVTSLLIGYLASFHFPAPRREDLRDLTYWTTG